MDTKKGKNKGKKGATTTAAPQTSEDKTVTSTTKESTPPKVPQKLENNASLPPATKQERYKKAFSLMDKDSSGEISKAEFKAFFDEHGLGKTWTHEQMDDMFDEIDTDRGGTIDVNNFLDALIKEHPNRDLVTFVNELLHEKKVPEEYEGETEEERKERIGQIKAATKLKREEEYKRIGPEKYSHDVLGIEATAYKKYQKAFTLLDLNDNGHISHEELVFVLDQFHLGTGLTKQEVDTLFKDVDNDKDGIISFMDFLESLNTEHPNKPLLGIIAAVHTKSKEIKDFKFENKQRIATEGLSSLRGPQKSKPLKATPAKAKQDYDISEIHLKDDEFTKFNKVFDEMDIDSNGCVSKEEFEKVVRLYFEKKDVSDEDINTNFTAIDQDNSGAITLYEFLKALEDNKCPLLANLANMIASDDKTSQKHQQLEDLKKQKALFDSANPIPYARDILRMPEFQRTKYQKAFSLIDLDNSGRITKQEFEVVLKQFNLIKTPTREAIDELYNSVDIDGSGGISLLEFWNALGGDKPNKKLAGMVDTIIRKEKEILDYIKKQGIKRLPTPATPEISPVKSKTMNNATDKKGSTEIDDLKKIIAQKDIEIAELNELLKTRDEDNAGLLNSKQALEKKIADYEKQLESLREENDKYLSERPEIDKVRELIESIVGLVVADPHSQKDENPNTSPKGQLEKIQSEFERRVSMITDLNKKVEELQKYKDDTSEQVTRLTTQLEDQKSSLGQNHTEVEHLKEQMKTMTSHEEVERLKQEKTDLGNQLDNLRKDMEHIKNEKDTLQTEKHLLDEKVKEYENKTTEATSQHDELARELKELKEKHDHDQEDIKSLNERLGKMVNHEEFEQVKKERDDKTHELDKLKAEIDHLKEAKNLLEINQQQHNEKEGDLEKEKQDMNVHLTEAKNKIENLEATNHDHVQEIERLKGIMSTMTSHDDTEKLKKEKEELATENEKLRKDIEAIKTEEKSLESEQKTSHERIEELEKEKGDLNVRISNLENELEKAKVESHNALEETKRLNDKLSTMVPKEDYDKLSKEHGDTQGDTETLRATEMALKNEKERLEAENGHLKQRVDDLEKFNKDNDAEIAKLKSDLDNSKSNLDQSHKEIEDLKQEMSKMTSSEEHDKLKHEKDNLAHEVENLRKEVQNIKTEEESVDVERNNFKTRAEELEKQKDELKINLTKLQNEFDDIKAKHSEAEEEVQKLRDKVSTMTSHEEVEKIKKERDDLVKANDDLREEIGKSKTEKGSAEEEQHHLQDEVKKLEEENRKITLENNTLTREVEDLTSKKTENEEEIKTLKERVENMTGEEEVNRIKKERDDKAKEAEDLRTEIEHIKTEKGTLEHDQSLLKTEVEELKAQREDLNVQINNHKNEIEKLQTDNENHKKEIDQLTAKLSTMVPKEQVDELKKEQAELKHESEDLHNLEVSMENEKKRLEGENAQLTEKINELQKKNDEKEAEIEKLTSKLESVEQEATSLTEKIVHLNNDKNSQVNELAKQKDEIAEERDKIAQELEALKVKDSQDLAEIQNLKEKESQMINKEEFEKLAQERESLRDEVEKLKEKVAALEIERTQISGQIEELTKQRDDAVHEKEALQEKDTQNLAEIQNLRDNAVNQEEFEKLQQKNEELIEEIKSLKAQIDDDKIVSLNSVPENMMTQMIPYQEVQRDDGLSIEEIQTIRSEILGKILDEESFLKKILQSISSVAGEAYKNPVKDSSEEVSRVHSRRLSLIKDPGLSSGNMIDLETAQKLGKLLSKPEEPANEGVAPGFGPNQVPTMTELQQKFGEIKQLRQDIVKRLEVEKAAKEYIKEQKKEKEQENYQLKEELSRYQNDTQRNLEHIIHDEGAESPKGGIKQEGQNESSPPYTKYEFRELIKERDFLLKQLHQMTEALNKKQLKTSIQGEDYQVSSDLREILEAVENHLEAIRAQNESVRIRVQESEQPQDESLLQVFDFNVEEITKLLQKLQKVKILSPTSPKKKTLSMPSSMKKRDLISQSPIKPVYEVNVPSEKSEEHEEEVAERNPEVVGNFVLNLETIKFLIKHLEGYLQQLEQNKEAATGEQENREAGVDISKDDQVKGFIAHIKQAGLEDFMSLVKDVRDLTVQNASMKKQLQNLQKPEEDIEISQSSPVAKRLQNMNEFGSNASQNQLGESFDNNELEGSVVISEAEQTYPSELEIVTPKRQKSALTTQKSGVRLSEFKRQFTEKIEEEELLKEKLENLTKANEKLCQELLEKGMEIEKLTEDIEAIKGNKEIASRNDEELNKVQETLENMKKTNENLSEENARKISEVERLSQDLQKALEEKNEFVNKNDEENKKLQGILENLKKENENLVQESSQKSAQLEKLNQELQKVAEQEKEVAHKEAEEYKKLQVAFENLKKDQENLIEEGSRKQSEFEKIEKERHQLGKISKIYEEENAKLKATYDDVLVKLKNLEQSTSQLVKDSQAIKKENANLQKQNEALLRKLQEGAESMIDLTATKEDNAEKKMLAPRILIEGSDQKRFLSPSRDISRNSKYILLNFELNLFSLQREQIFSQSQLPHPSLAV